MQIHEIIKSRIIIYLTIKYLVNGTIILKAMFQLILRDYGSKTGTRTVIPKYIVPELELEL